MNWTVETLDERVDAELAELPSDMRAKFIWIGELIEAKGLESLWKEQRKPDDQFERFEKAMDERPCF